MHTQHVVVAACREIMEVRRVMLEVEERQRKALQELHLKILRDLDRVSKRCTCVLVQLPMIVCSSARLGMLSWCEVLQWRSVAVNQGVL